MPDHPDPPTLQVARAIRDVLEDSGLSMLDQREALAIAGHLVPASVHPLRTPDVSPPADA